MEIRWWMVLWIYPMLCNNLQGARPRNLSNDLERIAEEEANVSTPGEKTGRRVRPQASWYNFIRHSDQTNSRRSNRGRGGKRPTLQGRPGPMGPSGPPGPPGPPGALVTKEVLLREFKDMVRAEAEKRAEQIIIEKCPGCPFIRNTTLHLLELEDINVVPKVTAGFHHQLKANVVVQRKTFHELSNFQMPFGGGAFHRGKDFSPDLGRFIAQRSGVYQFSVNLHVTHEGQRKGQRRKLNRRQNIRVLVCIQSLCKQHTSLEFISGIESNSRVFTISVNGLLFLMENQYASIFVDNSSSKSITIQSGSQFSGVLVGV